MRDDRARLIVIVSSVVLISAVAAALDIVHLDVIGAGLFGSSGGDISTRSTVAAALLLTAAIWLVSAIVAAIWGDHARRWWLPTAVAAGIDATSAVRSSATSTQQAPANSAIDNLGFTVYAPATPAVSGSTPTIVSEGQSTNGDPLPSIAMSWGDGDSSVDITEFKAPGPVDGGACAVTYGGPCVKLGTSNKGYTVWQLADEPDGIRTVFAFLIGSTYVIEHREGPVDAMTKAQILADADSYVVSTPDPSTTVVLGS